MRSCTSVLTHSLHCSVYPLCKPTRLCHRLYCLWLKMCCTKQDRKASEPTGWRISVHQLQFYKWQYHGKNRSGVINFTFLCLSFLICKIRNSSLHCRSLAPGWELPWDWPAQSKCEGVHLPPAPARKTRCFFLCYKTIKLFQIEYGALQVFWDLFVHSFFGVKDMTSSFQVSSGDCNTTTMVCGQLWANF